MAAYQQALKISPNSKDAQKAAEGLAAKMR